ncbi:hypothetical protein ACVINU_005438 [Bradyrhizobium diazoefficiens]
MSPGSIARSNASSVSENCCRLWFSATITEKPSCFSVSPMVRASLTALSSFGTFL